MRIIYNLQKKLFTFIGDIQWLGWKHPFWFYINSQGYKLRGEHYRKLAKLIKPGDILIRRFDRYLDSYILPGQWTHLGLYVGDDNGNTEQVIHAMSEGVLEEDVLNFMRTDYMIVLRHPDQVKVEKAIEIAKSIVGKPYDFGFDFENSDRFSCTELVSYCYPGLVHGKKILGKKRIIADDFVTCTELSIVWDSRMEESKPVVEAYFHKLQIQKFSK